MGDLPEPPQEDSLGELQPADGVLLGVHLEVVGEQEGRHHEERVRHQRAVEQDLLQRVVVRLELYKLLLVEKRFSF